MAKPAEQPASTTSRIGKRPIPLPQGVAFTATGSEVQIKGPKGTMKRVVPDMVSVAQDGAELKVSTTAPAVHARRGEQAIPDQLPQALRRECPGHP